MRSQKHRSTRKNSQNFTRHDDLIIDVALKLGASDAKRINPSEVVVSEWVRFKCQYGCPEYGRRLTCPPFTPSIEQVRRMLSEYRNILLVRFEQPPIPEKVGAEGFMKEFNKRQSEVNDITLKIENELMLRGYYKTFSMEPGICTRCEECVRQGDRCRHPAEARPSPESLGIDMFSTVKNTGWRVNVKTGIYENWTNYALILVD
ncbi:MAG: DUF2284 domain-containing protein [Candidatus Atabeyarchaeum deiterrae]